MKGDLRGAGERLLTEMKARYEVDVAGMAAGLRARLESRLALTPLPLEADLAERRGRFGVGRVATFAFEAAGLRKGVLTEIRLWPVIEGFALTLLPRPDVAAPIFGADFMLLPSRIAANADVYGPPALTRGVLAPLAASFARLGSGTGPTWTTAIGSGEGLHARVTPRLVDELFAALTGALGQYLDVLAAAPATADATESMRSGAAFFAAFHAHGPRRGPMRWLFGDGWAERYSHLAFE